MLLNSFHPSEFLRELMEEYRISAYRLAKDTFIPQSVNQHPKMTRCQR